MGPTHLVIPDAHVEHGQDLRRFDWLGQIIMDERPDTVICLGDFADMPSLCSYDKGQRKYEGRRYALDVQATHDAMERMFAPIQKHNAMQAKAHHTRYKPRFVMLYGNHENRIERATQLEPMLADTIGLSDLRYEEYGWETHPFLTEVEIDGVTYSHYFVSGVMARPIGGEHPAASLIAKQHRSCTAGHLHLADWCQRRQVGGKHIMGLLAGCYFEHESDFVPHSVNSMYWRGLVIKRNVVDGCYDPQFLSLNTIKKRYL